MPGALASASLTPCQPVLQVGGAEAADDRHLALAVRSLIGLLAHDPAGREIVDAVEREPLRRRRVRIPGDDRDAGVDRAVDRVGEELAVERRDRDAVHLLRDVRLENLLLLQLIRARGRVPENLDVPQLLRGPLRADARVVEDRDVERLRHDGEAEAPASPAASLAGGGLATAAAGEDATAESTARLGNRSASSSEDRRAVTSPGARPRGY